MKKKHHTWIVNYMAMLSLLAIFAVGSLVLMNVGVHVYKNIVENNGENFRLRASLSYAATKVRQYDREGAISVVKEGDTPVLVLKEEIEGVPYCTMLYAYKGSLRELFQEEGWKHELEDGLEIMDLQDFQIAKEGKTLSFTAVEGEEEETLQLYLRSDVAE